MEVSNSFEGVVTEVNPQTSYVHLVNKETKRAVSVIDRSFKYGKGDKLLVSGHLIFGPVVSHLRQKYEIPESEVNQWKHAILSYSRVLKHEVAKTLFDEKPAPVSVFPVEPVLAAPEIPKLSVSSVVEPVSKPSTSLLEDIPEWSKHLVNTFWKEVRTGAVLEILKLNKKTDGTWDCEVKYHDLGKRHRKWSRQTLGSIFTDHVQIVCPFWDGDNNGH